MFARDMGAPNVGVPINWQARAEAAEAKLKSYGNTCDECGKPIEWCNAEAMVRARDEWIVKLEKQLAAAEAENKRLRDDKVLLHAQIDRLKAQLKASTPVVF